MIPVIPKIPEIESGMARRFSPEIPVYLCIPEFPENLRPAPPGQAPTDPDVSK